MIRLEGISKYYNSDTNVVLGLRRVNLELKLGEFVAVTGESGSGKSTLANVISGLDKYDEGELYINGEETSYFSIEEQEQYRKQYVGFVFQNYNIIDSFTVLENVMAALMIQGYDTKSRKKRALELIDKVGLTSHKNHRASKLSGGQKQRAVIARALAKDCPIIVADEPTGNLDVKTGEMIMALLKEVSKDKLVVLVTHNYEQAAPYVTRKIRMFDGEIVEDKQIFETKTVAPTEPKAPINLALLDVLKMSLLSIFRMPKKSILVFITLMFAMVGINSLYALNNYVPFLVVGGNNYNNLFPNNFEGRVIVTKKDSTKFSQTELDDLLARNNVIDVVHNDRLLDGYYSVTDGTENNEIRTTAMPSTYVLESELSSGRLPQTKDEIVVRNRSYNAEKFTLNQVVRLNYFMGGPWEEMLNLNRFEQINMTVVGILKGDWGNYDMVVHPSFYNQNTTNTYNPDNFMAIRGSGGMLGATKTGEDENFSLEYERSIGIDQSLPDQQINIHAILYAALLDNYNMTPPELQSMPVSLTRSGSKFEDPRTISVTIAGELSAQAGNQTELTMNANTYTSLFGEGPYQIAVFVKDSFEANKLMSSLKDDYHTIHPASYEGESYGLGGLSFLTFLTFGLLGSFLYVIINLVIKSVIQSRKKDFVIFRSIGASKKDLKRMLVVEQIIYAIISYALSMVVLVIMNQSIKGFKVLRFIDLGFYFVSFAGFLAVLLLITRKFSIRLFGRSVITTLKSE